MPIIESFPCNVCGYVFGWLWQVCDEDRPDFYYCYKCGHKLFDEDVKLIGGDSDLKDLAGGDSDLKDLAGGDSDQDEQSDLPEDIQ